MPPDTKLRTRSLAFLSTVFLLTILGSMAAGVLLYHPETPLADEWNPTKPLNPSQPKTLLTQYKLSQALADPTACSAALRLGGAQFTEKPDQIKDAQCHIMAKRDLRSLRVSRLSSVDTTCQTALRLLMWETHVVQPAANAIFGTSVSKMDHFGSYSCRKIRGSSNRMSIHATASAIDIAGFRLANGRQITLKSGWNGAADEAKFLRRVRNGACNWFRLTLSPDYNALHHDHFHLEQGRWPGCR